ncbi:MAG: M23 family metallopeptidase [Ferruginibacter sp.]
MRILIFISIFFLTSCYVSKNPVREEAIRLRKGLVKEDTSYIYALPFEKGRSFRVIQGYFSQFSHKERAAIDFNFKRGTKITAAREGIVVRVKEDGTSGGLNKKYRSQGNHIVIQHPDGSRAGYWHLQTDGALVNVGDSVKKGQVIGLSGKTGYAAVPHLHFIVWKSDHHGWQAIPTHFQTSKGVKYLEFWGKYKN